MKRVTDPTFKYTPSFSTDLKKKFKRMEQERKAKEKPAPEPVSTVTHLSARKKK